MAIAVWSDLPKELLELIADHLQTKTDISRFRSVCKSWRFAVQPFQNTLVLPSYLGHRSNWVLTESRVYYLSPPADSVNPTSDLWGWLVKLRFKEIQQVGGQLHLINPLSPLQIKPLPDSFPRVIHSLQFRVVELAKSYTLQYSDVNQSHYKVAFSPNPDCPSLMIINGGLLSHQKLGQRTLTLIEDMISQLSYEDVVLYKGKFCAVDEFGRTVLLDPSSLNITEIVSSNPEMAGGNKRKKLLESNGELLLVDKHLYHTGLRVQPFKVFKLKLDQHRWVEVQSLDDQILFLGHDCSFSVSARHFGRCKGNCILYAEPCFMVFDLDDGSISPVEQHPEYASIFYPPSTWPPRPNIRQLTQHNAAPSHSGDPAAKKQKGLA